MLDCRQQDPEHQLFICCVLSRERGRRPSPSGGRWCVYGCGDLSEAAGVHNKYCRAETFVVRYSRR